MENLNEKVEVDDEGEYSDIIIAKVEKKKM